MEDLLFKVSRTRSDLLRSSASNLHCGSYLRPEFKLFESKRLLVVVSPEWQSRVSAPLA